MSGARTSARDARRAASARRRRDAAHALVGAVVGLVSAVGTYAVVRGEDRALGLPARWTLAIGALAALVASIVLTRRAGRVVDPGRPATRVTARWSLPAVLAAYVAAMGAVGVIAGWTR